MGQKEQLPFDTERLSSPQEEEDEQDQPKDFSRVYDYEDEDDNDDEDDIRNIDDEEVEQQATDTVRVFQTEGTPFISHANSMSDLSLRGIMTNGGFLQSRKVVSFVPSSRRLAIIQSNNQGNSANNNQLPKAHPIHANLSNPVVIPRPLPRSSVCKSSASSVTGHITCDDNTSCRHESVLPTPLMYSRASPVQSLSGDIEEVIGEEEEHGMYGEDTGSVASEFSHRGEESGVISPSDLPSSPGEVELSPPRRQVTQMHQPQNQQNVQQNMMNGTGRRPAIGLAMNRSNNQLTMNAGMQYLNSCLPPPIPVRSHPGSQRGGSIHNYVQYPPDNPPPRPPKGIRIQQRVNQTTEVPFLGAIEDDLSNIPWIPPPPGFGDDVPEVSEPVAPKLPVKQSVDQVPRKQRLTKSSPTSLIQDKKILSHPKSYLETDLDSLDDDHQQQSNNRQVLPDLAHNGSKNSSLKDTLVDSSDDDDYQILEKCLTLGRKSSSVNAMPSRMKSVASQPNESSNKNISRPNFSVKQNLHQISSNQVDQKENRLQQSFHNQNNNHRNVTQSALQLPISNTGNNMNNNDSSDDDDDYQILEKCLTLGRKSSSVKAMPSRRVVTHPLPKATEV